MKYTVHFLNGNKLSLDEGNYKRLKDPRRSMAGPLYAPMKDGEAIFFRNILMVVPEDVKIKEDSWRDSPHVVRFIDGLTIGLSDIERKSVERSLRDTSNKKFVLLRNGVLIYHNLVWFIAHRGSEWLKDDKESEPVLPGKLPKVPPKIKIPKNTVVLSPLCCGEPPGIRWMLCKDGKKRYIRQCSVCGKKGKLVKAADIENLDEISEVISV